MKISVALCTYNGGLYLREQLQSFLSQSLSPDELVVVDDASTDETIRILEDFRSKAPIEVCIHRNSRNIGLIANFEKALKLCTGDIIFPSDQDDVWLPSKIEKMSSLFADHTVTVVACNASLADVNLTSLGTDLWSAVRLSQAEISKVDSGEAFERLVVGNFVAGMAMAVRANFVPAALPIPDCWVHDAWVSLVSAATGGFRLVPEALVQYRLHGRNAIGVEAVSLWAHLRRAFRLPADALVVREKQLEVALERLSSRLSRLRREALSERIIHLRIRGNLPFRRMSRIPVVFRELLSGRYRRFSLGPIAAVRDIVRSVPSNKSDKKS